VGGTGIERRWGKETLGVELREPTTGAMSRLDLVVGSSRQKVKKLGVEPMINGLVDLGLAITSREGTTKGGDGGLGKLKESGLINNDIERGVWFGAKDVVGVVSHGGDTLVASELDKLVLLDFGFFLGIRELAASLVMGTLGSFEPDFGLLDRGLGLGGGSLESGSFGSVRVGWGHGQRRNEKETGGKGTRERRKHN